jgi:hypothetical protein
VVTAEVPWLDSLLAEELDPLEDSLALEDVVVGVSGPLPVEALEEWELGVVAVFFVERAGSWPEASWT